MSLSTLPKGQGFIHTTNTDEVFGAYSMLKDPSNSTSRIAVIAGASGRGKTTIMQELLARQQPRSHTLLPAEIGLRIRQRATPQVLCRDIAELLNEKPRGQNGFAAMDAAAEAINRNQIEVVFFDEGERLTAYTFEAIQELHDRTNCRFIVFGLREVLEMVRTREKFSSRVGFKVELQQLDIEEVLNVVLPQICAQRWYFNPSDEHHRQVGSWLWGKTQPSLRELRSAIERASLLAAGAGADHIAETHLKQALAVASGKSKNENSETSK